MHYLQITLYGNTVKDYLIALFIFVATLFIAKFIYHLLRKTVCEWMSRVQTVFEKENLIRLCALACYLIPLMALAVVQHRLTLPKEIAGWISIGLVILGQIIFLVILLNVVGPIVEILPIKYTRTTAKDDRKYLEIQRQAIEKSKRHVRQLVTILIILIPALTVLSYLAVVPYSIWGLPALILTVELVLCIRALLLPKRHFRQIETVTSSEETYPEPEALPPQNDPDLKIKQDIVTFFLEIHKHQRRALSGYAAEHRLVDSRTFAPNYIYELRLSKDGNWQSRRMTIGPIGEDTGSRSKCFYVIYDDHLVLKIPPTPITNLDQYIKILRKERTIVRKLAMKECIIPSVSVILKLIQPSSGEKTESSEETETNYLRLLNVFSELQKYLKIGDSFVFFMDLSKYYFLGHVIQALHDTEKRIDDEIARHSEVVGDYSRFEDRHGFENAQIYLEVEKVYGEYQARLKGLMKKFDLPATLPQEQSKKWFFSHLVGNRVTEIGKGFNALFVSELNTLIEEVINQNITAIQAYRDTVKKSIYKSAFAQNKVYMEGIATNLLELLAHLREKGVAMRDLKPDNLFVAGERERYPSFLAYPDSYKIGLIDVETAVIFAKANIKTIDQPPLGGTPQYATPSHLFHNQLLDQVYGNISKILHLQDWYAIIAIIYKTVTGEHLFERTARLFPTMVNLINVSSQQVAERANVFEKVSQMFWRSSLGEFQMKIIENKDILKSLDVIVSEPVRKMLHHYVQNAKENIEHKLRDFVTSEDVSLSAKDRQYLLSCPYEKIKELRQKWENGEKTKKALPIDSRGIMDLLSALEGLKERLERKTQALQLLGQSAQKISVHDLLEVMFQTVLEQMCKEEWSERLSADPTDFSDAAATVEATREWQTVTVQL